MSENTGPLFEPITMGCLFIAAYHTLIDLRTQARGNWDIQAGGDPLSTGVMRTLSNPTLRT